MAFKFFFIAALVGFVSQATGNSTGAPTAACIDMIPQHHTEPQNTTVPYNLAVSRNAIRSGDEVKLTISGKTSADTIKGFMVQARQGDTPVGEFIVSADDKIVQTINCEPGNKNTVTHRKHEGIPDPKSITLKWKAPEDLKEEIQFRATIALNGGVFWVGHLSNTVKIH